MPDVSVLAAIITTAGTLGGALGGVVLTNWAGFRREDQAARRQELTARQERADAGAASREQAYSDLLESTAQLRVHAEITCRRHWPDLNTRLGAAQDYALAAGRQAARAALLSTADQAQAALALAAAAGELSGWLVTCAQLASSSEPGKQVLAGLVDGTPDFTKLDACTTAFIGLAKIS